MLMKMPDAVLRQPGDMAPWWVVAYVACLPLPGIAEAILVLGALFTIARLLQLRAVGQATRLLTAEAWGLTSLLFLAYWVPQLIAAVDALDPGKAFGKSLSALRYLPFMWMVAIAVATPARRRITLGGMAVLAGLWCLDALVQPLWGGSLLAGALDGVRQGLGGSPLCPLDEVQAVGRFNGIFTECNPKLGQVLAALSPFVLLPLARGRGWWASGVLALGVVVMLTGSRAAWISYGLVVVMCGMRIIGWRGLAVLGCGGVLAACLLAWSVPGIGARIDATRVALEGTTAGADAALAGRGRIWSGALCMVAAHPINGVGVRGFRHAWEGCDPAPDAPAAWGEGPALHAHQLLLEILSETGLVGLLLWLAGAALAIRAWRYADAAARQRAQPAAIAASVALFPLNTHLAVYSAFWGGMILLLVALYAGSIAARK